MACPQLLFSGPTLPSRVTCLACPATPSHPLATSIYHPLQPGFKFKFGGGVPWSRARVLAPQVVTAASVAGEVTAGLFFLLGCLLLKPVLCNS